MVISSKATSPYTLLERNTLNAPLPQSPPDILNECNILSSDTYHRHFNGSFGVSFLPTTDNAQLTLSYREKINYFFPKWFYVAFDSAYICVIINLCYVDTNIMAFWMSRIMSMKDGKHRSNHSYQQIMNLINFPREELFPS